MINENFIKFSSYLKILNSYRYLLLAIYLSFFVIFYLLGNFKVNHGLNISFSIKNTQIDKVFNNFIYLENTFETNFNEDEIIPMRGFVDKNGKYEELSAFYRDLTKKEILKDIINFKELKEISYTINVQNEKVTMNFASEKKDLIKDINEIDFYKKIVNSIKNQYQYQLTEYMEVIRDLTNLEKNRIETKISKKNKQLELLSIYENNNFFTTIVNFQNTIIDLEDQYLRADTKLNLCEGLYIKINNDLKNINYLRNFTQSIKTFYNDIILNAFLYFIFATILFLFLIFIAIIVKEEKLNAK